MLLKIPKVKHIHTDISYGQFGRINYFNIKQSSFGSSIVHWTPTVQSSPTWFMHLYQEHVSPINSLRNPWVCLTRLGTKKKDVKHKIYVISISYTLFEWPKISSVVSSYSYNQLVWVILDHFSPKVTVIRDICKILQKSFSTNSSKTLTADFYLIWATAW